MLVNIQSSHGSFKIGMYPSNDGNSRILHDSRLFFGQLLGFPHCRCWGKYIPTSLFLGYMIASYMGIVIIQWNVTVRTLFHCQSVKLLEQKGLDWNSKIKWCCSWWLSPLKKRVIEHNLQQILCKSFILNHQETTSLSPEPEKKVTWISLNSEPFFSNVVVHSNRFPEGKRGIQNLTSHNETQQKSIQCCKMLIPPSTVHFQWQHMKFTLTSIPSSQGFHPVLRNHHQAISAW